MVPVNYWAVLVAAVLSMVLGSLWYGPLFGKTWIRLMGWSKSDVEKGRKEMNGAKMAKQYGIQAVGSLFMAFVLAHALVFAKAYLHEEGISAGLQTGFWNWLGFIAPVTLTSVLWEGKPWKLWLINNSYNLVTLMAMGVLLSLWV
jgi:hypothetical protein